MKNLLKDIRLLSRNKIENKRVLLRVDFNVQLTKHKTIADDIRIIKALPTIELLLKNNNKIILISHLSRPKGRDTNLSLQPIAEYLQTLLPKQKVILINDFLSAQGKEQLEKQKHNEVILLENIRFYEGEQTNDEKFIKALASLGDVYISDAFGVSHRSEASVVGIPEILPSYCGLLLEKEVDAVTKLITHPKHPVVAIIGGAKISTKIIFLSKLIAIVDHLLIGGALANTFLVAQGIGVGTSLAEKTHLEQAKRIMHLAKEKGVSISLPLDVVGLENEKEEKVYNVFEIPTHFSILDIGPQTQAAWSVIVNKANTILWNGPVGLAEDERFARGTNFLFYSITQNDHAFSLVGGGDTLAAVSDKKYLEKITHVSTGGGAMLELVENGTLPGIEALRK